ncbi:MAG: hypothetical protein IMZ47_06050 [Firmicutes bacterium]|nr:hypothetical protein [Bacillota bacterium]
MSFKHYILTRFNAGLYGTPDTLSKQNKIDPDAWMEHRLLLFEKFTLASIKNQSCQNFSWLLLMDGLTPKRFIQRIEKFNYPNIKICYTDVSIYSSNMGDPKIWGIEVYKQNDFNIITTRIDNDDVFHKDYVKEIQCQYTKALTVVKPFVISFPLGYVLNLETGQIVPYTYGGNNCPSLVSLGNEQDFKSVFCCEHTAIRKKYKTFTVQESKPFWLDVVHSRNLGTAVRQHFHKSKDRKMLATVMAEFGIKK